jgi:signal transduction histidine kinase
MAARGVAQLTSDATLARLPLGRLRFPDSLEASFSEYHFQQSVAFTRFALVLAVVLYALFGILDLFIVPDVASSIWIVRYAIFCPLALAVLGFTFTRWYKPIAQPMLCGLAAICGLGIVAMIAIADVSGGYLYYAGLLLVIPWAYTVLRLRFSYATVAAAAIMVGYEIVAVWLKSTPLDILINNNFFFLSSVIIGMVAGYTIERSIRTDFLQRGLIETQRAELAERNVHLDSALQLSLEEVRRKAEQLQASRARIVAAADAERRRIERNLHDGAQQHLAALAVQLRLVSKLADDDLEAAKTLLHELRQQVEDTVQELRNLAHGIYPPLLMDQGLPAALSAAAKRSALAVTVEAATLRRYPPEVEATVYFCCLEALQNAYKHAGDGVSVTIRVEEDAAGLLFEVIDDGVGFESQGRGLGAGFVNMTDRLGAVGGSLQVDSAPGRGTRVTGRLPLTLGTERSTSAANPGRVSSFASHPTLSNGTHASELTSS